MYQPIHICVVHTMQVRDMSQEVRDSVGTRLLNLTLHELFVWKFMQASGFLV